MLTKELIAKVRRIEIRTRRLVDELTGGAYHSAFKGKGMEFDEVRGYLPGDDVRAIDWNVTARTGQPHVKKFVEERELQVLILADMSASGDFGSGQQAKRDLCAELAALLYFSAIRNNDRVGLLLFTDQVELHLPPRKGRRHALRGIRELIAFRRQHTGTCIRRAIETLMKVTHRRCVVFLISDFIDTDSGYARALAIASQRHDIVALHIADPREREIPAAGMINLEDAESGARLAFPASVNAACRARYRAAAAAHHRRIVRLCRRAGVDHADVVTDQDYVKPLMRLFRERQQRR